MRFEIKHPEDRQGAEQLRESFGISELTARILAARGLDVDNAAQYLYPDEEQILSPFEFDAMGEVCERIEEAIACGEKIAVYSDYDTDGVCAAAIMYHCLRWLGTEPIMYVPDRFTEGYGTNSRAIGELCREAQLIISVDCGIRSVEDVRLARSMGVDFIIADHHECGELPDTPFILDPKKPDESYPFKYLCGAGIAFKIAYALIDDEEQLAQLMQYAAVATIADMVPLKGENRAIAALGLRHLKEAPALGWSALADAAGIDIKKANSTDVGFALSPRINAAGRMANGRIALELLTTGDEVRAAQAAAQLNELNTKRQQLQREVADKCTRQIAKLNLSRVKMLVVCGEEFDEGVVGLAASLLAERYHRPAVVLKRAEGRLIGSARSIEGIDLYAVLDSCSQLYEKFGGHEMAAGLTLPEKNLEKFKERTNSYIEERYPSDVFVKTVKYDLALRADEVTLEDAESLSALEPFGEGNEQPVFLLENVSMSGIRRIGSGGRHAKLRADDALNMVYFNAPPLAEGAKADVCGEIGVNEYNGTRSVQVIVRSLMQKTVSEAADELSFIKGFPSEICALYKLMQSPKDYRLYRSAEDFRQALSERNEDPIGMAVSVGALIGEAAFKALGIEGIDVINGDPSPYRSENAVIMHSGGKRALDNFDEVFLCGGLARIEEYPDAHILMNSGLFKAYKAQAQRFYVPWEQAMEYYRAFAACAAGDSISQMLRSIEKSSPRFTMEKLWYMFNVFSEQKLIEAKKSDKIIFISQDKPSRRSLTKLAFETVLR